MNKPTPSLFSQRDRNPGDRIVYEHWYIPKMNYHWYITEFSFRLGGIGYGWCTLDRDDKANWCLILFFVMVEMMGAVFDKDWRAKPFKQCITKARELEEMYPM